MSDTLQFKCVQCGKDFWERWHYRSDYSAKAPDVDICQECRSTVLIDKARRVKLKLLRHSVTTIELLQAEVTVLRELVVQTIPEHHYWEKVYEVVKQTRKANDEINTVPVVKGDTHGV